jgi:hypothetical protein
MYSPPPSSVALLPLNEQYDAKRVPPYTQTAPPYSALEPVTSTSFISTFAAEAT